MSKHKKNRGGNSTQYQGFYAHIALSGFKNPQEIKKACAEMDFDSYTVGHEDKARDLEIMPFAEFARGFSEFRIPPAMLAGLIKANYTAYLDGYHGKEFKQRTICEEI